MRIQTEQSLRLPSEKFKRKLGVKRGTFEAMLEVLKEREGQKKKKAERPLYAWKTNWC